MRSSHVFRAGSAIALAGLVACAEQPTTSPTDVDARKVDGVESAKKSPGSDEVVKVSPLLKRINARLAAKGSNLRVDRGELLYGAKAYDAASPTVIVANDRTHTLPYQWVPGDPRRGGAEGVSYAIDPDLRTTAFGIPNLPAIEVDGGGFRPSTQAELEGYIEEAMQAWRDRRCSDSRIERVAVPAGTDPDQLDQVLLGNPVNSNYAQPSDIVQAGWQPPEFFEAIIAGGSDAILGISFTFTFVDDQNTPDPSDDVETDINGDGNRDTGLVEIYYNPSFIYTNRGTPGGFIDFYSVITHESGHGLGLAHFGKVFITKKDAADGFQVSDVKYAPKALMNAVYVEGRDEITGSDNGSFCQIWAHQ
jgi:hypothetical protein